MKKKFLLIFFVFSLLFVLESGSAFASLNGGVFGIKSLDLKSPKNKMPIGVDYVGQTISGEKYGKLNIIGKLLKTFGMKFKKSDPEKDIIVNVDRGRFNLVRDRNTGILFMGNKIPDLDTWNPDQQNEDGDYLAPPTAQENEEKVRAAANTHKLNPKLVDAIYGRLAPVTPRSSVRNGNSNGEFLPSSPAHSLSEKGSDFCDSESDNEYDPIPFFGHGSELGI